MLSPFAIKKLEHLTMDYMKITCPDGQCYGVLAVHRINWALGMLHLILAAFLIGVRSTRNSRASIQNGYFQNLKVTIDSRWWGPKIIAWAVLVVLSFFIPNEFFVVWGNYFALTGSVLFILYGLILLIDAAHSWAETCLERYEATESRAWEVILVGSTFGMYAGALAMIIVSYIFFAGSGCSLNQTFISLNLVLAVIVTGMAIHPTIQEYNSRSGLAQSAMVCIYATYLTLSAVCNGILFLWHN
jgi:serine incorporator 1/3